ncbi:unnamed protein product [Blepharisma stoltei]|uniref:FYVE-type domain-containing protein n=1 Tax=Blepharisma stoltei TaxID=1481888 RepID=A0AAU9KBM8_9CILI|nr:unnamed protein product [Blepharisma stoltei]
MGHNQSKHPEFHRDNLKKEGYVIMVSKSKEKRRWLVLSDKKLSYSLSLGTPPKNSTTINNKFRVTYDNSSENSIECQVVNKKGKTQQWIIKCETVQEYRAWSLIIKHAQRPNWDDPRGSSSCKICNGKFTAVTRQHHCRKCGLAVCKKDSKEREIIPELGYNTKVRVCKNCIGKRSNETPDLNS